MGEKPDFDLEAIETWLKIISHVLLLIKRFSNLLLIIFSLYLVTFRSLMIPIEFKIFRLNG